MSVGIIDTSVYLALDSLGPDDVPERMLITTVTLAELAVGPLIATSTEQRAQRIAQLEVAEAEYDALPFDKRAAQAFGRVAGSLRRAGRKVAARRFDAMIAAVALAEDLPLYTGNAEDFRHISGLRVVPVPIQ